MKTIIIGDSRLCGLARLGEDETTWWHCVSGSKMSDHKTLLKSKKFKNYCRSAVLVFICVGINDIPEDILSRTTDKLDHLYVNIVNKYRRIVKAAKKHNPNNRVVIGTIASKDLDKTIKKYPQKSEYIDRVTIEHQRAFEKFVQKINEQCSNVFNESETGVHIPLHRRLRQHRGRKRTQFHYHKFHDGFLPTSDLFLVGRLRTSLTRIAMLEFLYSC